MYLGMGITYITLGQLFRGALVTPSMGNIVVKLRHVRYVESGKKIMYYG